MTDISDPVKPPPVGLTRAEEIVFHQGEPDRRPTLSRSDLARMYPGYFPGPASAELEYWKKRASDAESRLQIVERELSDLKTKGKGSK